MRPVDFKFPCVHLLESTHALHVEARTPQARATCCHATEFRHHQPSRSYVVVADFTVLFCSDRHYRRSAGPSSPAQSNLSDCNHAPPCVVARRLVDTRFSRLAPGYSKPYTRVVSRRLKSRFVCDHFFPPFLGVRAQIPISQTHRVLMLLSNQPASTAAPARDSLRA